MTSDKNNEIGACWVNGEIVDPLKGSISAVDHGIVVGDGVFETLKVIDGIPFAISRHLKRLTLSAQGLGIMLPDEDLVKEATEAVLEIDPIAERLRITWSSGPGPLSSNRGSSKGTLVVASSPGTNWPEAEKIHLSEWTRNENSALTGLKTTSYAENVRALQSANDKGCSEAIFLNTSGWLCEGTGTNIFLVIDGVLVTPDLSSGCLAGITRELVIEMHAVTERKVSLSEVSMASEAFLTSSTRDVSPISCLDEIFFPDAPGPETTKIMEKFSELLRSNANP